MRFGLIMRAFAPWPWFGGPFHGDGRGFTTSPDVTSRMKAWVDFDPTNGYVGKPNGKCDESSDVFGFAHATAIPVVRLEGQKVGTNTIYIKMHASGANPLINNKISPPIDMHISMTVGIRKGFLSVLANLTGDTFPHAEIMLQDEGLARRMVFTSATTGNRQVGPFRLFGDNKKPMNAICASFGLNEAGRFA